MKNLSLILSATALLLSSCGGSSDAVILVDAPRDPSPAEKAAFESAKTGTFLQNNHYGFAVRTVVNGQTIFSTTPISGERATTHYNYRSLPQGFATLPGQAIAGSFSFERSYRGFQGLRSGAYVMYDKNGHALLMDRYGIETALATFPTKGQATYQGPAFDLNERGNLTYHVDFWEKSGQGQIDGLSRYGTITLAPGNIEANRLHGIGYRGIVGKAEAARGQSMDYTLRFYGEHAEEIAGYANNDLETGDGVGFHGTRGDITE